MKSKNAILQLQCMYLIVSICGYSNVKMDSIWVVVVSNIGRKHQNSHDQLG